MSDLLRGLAVLALVAGNAFFVIGEYAVVTARRSALSARAVRWLQAALAPTDALTHALNTPYTRLPVGQGTIDRVLGLCTCANSPRPPAGTSRRGSRRWSARWRGVPMRTPRALGRQVVYRCATPTMSMSRSTCACMGGGVAAARRLIGRQE